MIKMLIYQKDIMTLNIYVPYDKSSKFKKRTAKRNRLVDNYIQRFQCPFLKN